MVRLMKELNDGELQDVLLQVRSDTNEIIAEIICGQVATEIKKKLNKLASTTYSASLNYRPRAIKD